MIKFKNIFLATMLVLAGGAGCAAPAYAEGESGDSTPATWLQISPTAATVTLMGGSTLVDNAENCPKDLDEGCAVEVKNIGTQSFRYRVYATPYVVSGENYDLDFSENSSTTYTQISRWITFRDNSGQYVKEITSEINPGETQLIRYRIQVPEDVPGGAQYAVIWAQTLPNTTNPNGVQTISQAGMVVYGRSIGDTVQTASVDDYGFQRFSFGGNLKAQATIKNTGNTDFDAYYYYTAKTFFGKEIYNEQDSISTFPDTEYHVNIDWENPPLLGIFTVNFRISAADTQVDETHIVVIMPVFGLVLLILLLTVIIVWIIIIIRKRKERKARTLV